MKTLLIIDSGLGQARAYMAKTLLGAAAQKAHLSLLITRRRRTGDCSGLPLPADSALNGKKCGWAILIARWRIRNCS
jgi:PTS system fructose-specific IIC component